MSTFTTPVVLAATLVAAGTILPVEAIPHAVLPITEEHLDVRYVDARNWLYLEPFEFASETLERILRIPAGFTTDFASTPRIVWPIFPPTGTYSKAAGGHDYLYRTPGICSRLQADETFKEMMVALKVAWEIRDLMFLAVREFGASSYKGGVA
jgi:hypothetical protein